MCLKKAFLLLLLLFPFQAANGENLINVAPITLTNAQEIADTKKLSAATNVVSSKVSPCIGQGKTHIECMCIYISEVRAYQQIYKDTVQKYPKWVGKVTYFENAQGMGVSTSFIGHQRQSDMIDTLQCN